MTAGTYARNIFQPHIDEGTRLRTDLLEIGKKLNTALFDARIAKMKAKDAQDALTTAEQELLFEEMIKGKEGVFGAVSKTGKDFQIIYDGFLAKLRGNQLAALSGRLYGTQQVLAHAEIAVEQLQTQFSALRHAADLQTAILKAVAV